MSNVVRIVPYEPRHREHFRALNLAWIEEHFAVEERDRRDLDDPETHILAPGGHIFMAESAGTAGAGEVLGACALIREHDGAYELAKMAVAPAARGRGVGRALGEAAIGKARALGAPYVELLSNTALAPALGLYRALGFVEVPLPATEYARANIKMVLRLLDHTTMTTTIPTTMRAVRMHEPGGPEVLRYEEIPVPRPKAGEALVRVEAAGVNFVDVYKRTGQYRVAPPLTLGEEGAGTVAAVGEGVTDVRVGDRVAWASVPGAYAEYAVVPADRLVPIPDGVTTDQAAALMLQGMTAHYLAISTYPLRQGDRCLVHAAAGGVGHLLVQIARRRGAYVVGTAGTDEKARLAREAGADEVIVYTRQDFVAETQRLTGGRALQVVYDSVGRTTFLPGLDLLAPRGMMVLFGQSSGKVDPIDPQILNQKGSLFLTRPSLVHYVATREELRWRAGELFEWVRSGTLHVRIGAEYPLARAADAHRALEGRQTTGKVLVRP